jgi:hypothetical protein
MFDNTLVHRIACKMACALLVPVCLAFAVLRLAATPASAQASPPAPEFPAEWEGRRLRPLVLTDVETRFARHFPGSLARLTDGHQVLVLRTVLRPTRMLHPAADCYRGVGWTIDRQQLQPDGENRLWRCFEAERGGRRMRVCEHIVDAQGRVFTDTSSWFWAATLEQSRGPWKALTVASPL